jgi:serine/threonine kinase 16
VYFQRCKPHSFIIIIIISNLDATLKLNGRSFKILKLLGEGGFSYVSEFDYSIIRSVPPPPTKQFKNSTHAIFGGQVYLAQDLESKRLFALKKIRCPLGSDSVKTALKEVEGKPIVSLYLTNFSLRKLM